MTAAEEREYEREVWQEQLTLYGKWLPELKTPIVAERRKKREWKAKADFARRKLAELESEK